MEKIYYNQMDPRWKNHPYPAAGASYANKTVGTSGCGPTCAAMIVSSCKETIFPNRMCDIAREQGYRVPGGTADGFFNYVANRWGIEFKRVKSSFEAHQACKEGWFVVICCGSGLWTTGGHFILAVGATDTDIEIYDPYLYAGKFNRNGRSGKVRLVGNSAWVNINTFKAYSNAQRFFAFKVSTATPVEVPEQETAQIAWVNTSSAGLNVRNNPNGAVVGSLPKATQVIVSKIENGWAKIGENKWVSNSYLTYSQPVVNQPKTMYVTASSLNVRQKANGSVITQISKGTAVTVVEEQNGWSKITSPTSGWVSTQYLANAQPTVSRNTVGQIKVFKASTKLYSNANLTGTRYDYKANTEAKVLENTSSNVDKVQIIKTGRVAYVSTSAYTSSSATVSTPAPAKPTIPNTVGQLKRFKATTNIYANSNLSGTVYTYKAKTQVKILQNVSTTVDKVYVVQTKRVGYVNKSAY